MISEKTSFSYQGYTGLTCLYIKQKKMDTELLYKYFRGETTEKENTRIVEWLENNAENKEYFQRERLLFDAVLFLDSSVICRKPKGHLYLYPILAVAAMLAIVFVMDLPHMHKPEVPPQSLRIPARPDSIEPLLKMIQKNHPFEYKINKEQNEIIIE